MKASGSGYFFYRSMPGKKMLEKKSSYIFNWLFFLFAIMSFFAGCFKKPHINENALLHQRACIESIDLKDPVRAQTHCELCLEFDAAMPECLNGIGLIALMNKDEEKAHLFFTKALRQDNDFSQARNNLGVIYFSRGDFVEALKYFDRALEIDPANIDARYNVGLTHFRLGVRLRAHNSEESISHLIEAKEQIKKLLALEPTYHHAFRDLGLIELNLYDQTELLNVRLEKLEYAKRAFMQCVESEPTDDGCYEGLAQVNLEEGLYEQSFANYFLCLTHAPNNSACRANIVSAYEKSARAQGSYQTFLNVVKNEPDNALAHEAFCAALFERGLDEEAVKECEIALRLKPDLANAHFRLAEYFTTVGNAERAVKHCQTFLICGRNEKQRQLEKCQEILTAVRR